jgi:LacI family transcriptional regulator
VRKVRLQDIAELANVSAATVSRVVRSSGYVSQDKRREVEEAMLSLGYVPVENTAPVVAPAAQVIGLLTPDTKANLLLPRLADNVNHAALKNGYNIVQINAGRNVNAVQLTSFINTFRSFNACGVIFNALDGDLDFMSIRKFIMNLPIPVVMTECAPDIFGFNKVLVNAREGIFLAVQHLVRHGHKKIAFLGPQPAGREVEVARVSGFKSACEALNCAETSVHIPASGCDVTEGYQVMKAYCGERECPTAIIGTDELLVGVGRYLYERGLRVPDNVSLVGLEDTLPHFSVPALTSLCFPEREIAENAVNIVLEAKKGKTMPKTILLSPCLVERDSVARPGMV